MIDFFVSFNKADRAWAEWVAYVLEEERFTVSFQSWDFRPGANFVLEMQKASAGTRRTIMILSPDYLSSPFAQSEWAAAFADDPLGEEGKLIPVMVRRCEPAGLLRQIVWIDLVDLPETVTRDRLIEGLKRRRAKPESRPAFPGAPPAPAAFPNDAPAVSLAASPFLPDLGRPPTDADRRRFVRSSFTTIAETFKSGLEALRKSGGKRIDVDIESKGDTDFVAEVFLDGKSRCICHIWLGGMISRDGISYFEGRSFAENTVNEILSIGDDGKQLYLTASMGGSFAGRDEGDLRRLSPEAAAHYLWRRFVAPLERGGASRF